MVSFDWLWFDIFAQDTKVRDFDTSVARPDHMCPSLGAMESEAAAEDSLL